MAVTAQVTGGTLSIGDTASPDFLIALGLDGGTITKSSFEKLVGLIGASTTVLNEPAAGGQITKASIIWVKGKDASGDPKKFKIIINGVTIPEVTELIMVSKTPTTGFTSISIVNDVGSSALLSIDYAVAG